LARTGTSGVASASGEFHKFSNFTILFLLFQSLILITHSRVKYICNVTQDVNFILFLKGLYPIFINAYTIQNLTDK